jgi:hypothetical protein
LRNEQVKQAFKDLINKVVLYRSKWGYVLRGTNIVMT